MDLPGRFVALFREARRRHVFRVALVYLAVSFVALQVAELLVPLLLLPDWMSRGVFFLLLIGFPLVLLLAWAYDLAPEAVQRSQPEPSPSSAGEDVSDEVAAGATGVSAPTIFFVVGLAAVGLALWAWTPVILSSTSHSRPPSASAVVAPGSALRLSISAPPGTALSRDPFDVAISPDGRTIVFAASSPDDSSELQLYRRSIAEYGAHPLPGVVGTSPFFSPDGRWVAYAHDDRLWKVSLLGGSPEPLADIVTWFAGGDWGTDGTIVYADGQVGLYRVAAGGGEPEQLRGLPGGGHTVRDPRWLPSGASVSYTESRPGNRRRVMLLTLGSEEVAVVVERGHNARFLPAQQLLLYHLDGNLLASTWNPEEEGLPGLPTPVLGGVAAGSRGENVDLADDGTLVYLPDAGLRERARLVWADTTGAIEPLSLPSGDINRYKGLRVSPEGTRLLFTQQLPTERQVDVWLYEVDSGHLRRVTGGQGDNWWPIWGPRGEVVYHNSNRGSSDAKGTALHLYATPLASFAEEPRLLARSAAGIQPQSWVPDGGALAFVDNTIADGIEGDETLRDIWLLDLTPETPERRPLLRTRFDETHPAFAPNGQWLAYVSDQSGEPEVYVRGYPAGASSLRVSSGGGTGPVWAPDGSALYFRSLDGDRVYRTPIERRSEESGARLVAGPPQPMIEGSFYGERPWGRMYDLHPDGSRFLMLQVLVEGPDYAAPKEVRVVVNWRQDATARLAAAP